MAHPRFKISKNDAGEYTFNLTAINGEKILASERYTSRGAPRMGSTPSRPTPATATATS
jgi:uncharacterized protein YegP (UPF0339 family)